MFLAVVNIDLDQALLPISLNLAIHAKPSETNSLILLSPSSTTGTQTSPRPAVVSGLMFLFALTRHGTLLFRLFKQRLVPLSALLPYRFLLWAESTLTAPRLNTSDLDWQLMLSWPRTISQRVNFCLGITLWARIILLSGLSTGSASELERWLCMSLLEFYIAW